VAYSSGFTANFSSIPCVAEPARLSWLLYGLLFSVNPPFLSCFFVLQMNVTGT